MNYLADKGFACYALDLPAHGDRRDEDENIHWQTLRGYVKEVKRVADEIGNPIVVGHSMGGYMVMIYMQEENPPAAILMAPIPFRRFPFSSFLKMTKNFPMMTMRTTGLLPTSIKNEGMYRQLFLHNAPDEVCRKGFNSIVPESSLTLIGSAVPLVRLDPELVSCPVLVTAAEHDYFFPAKAEERTAQVYGGDYRLYRGMGHNLMMENGWEDVAEDIHNWLAEQVH
jgi:alpha-beta hydrolase superfamily lysophospholipase